MVARGPFKQLHVLLGGSFKHISVTLGRGKILLARKAFSRVITQPVVES